MLAKIFVKSNFIKFNSKSFTHYIPRKELIFMDHPTYGKVYPVYIASEEQNRFNPKKIMPLIIFFSGMNSFLFLTGMGALPISNFFLALYYNEFLLFASVITNIYVVRKYFKYLTSYTKRVKSLFLMPCGSKLTLETFDGQVNRFENYDIYEFNIKNSYDKTAKDDKDKNLVIDDSSIFTNNDNNFSAKISWGMAKQNFFEGKRKILDYEIFSYIVHRFNVDTTITKFKAKDYTNSNSTYTNEERKRVLKYFENRTILQKINTNSYYYSFLKLRKQYEKKKEIKINNLF